VTDELGLALVTLMAEGTREGARAFVDQAQLRAPVVLADLELLAHLRVAAYPWTIVLDPTGKPVTAIRGGRGEDEFRALLRDVR
jgi:hypothetical protein